MLICPSNDAHLRNCHRYLFSGRKSVHTSGDAFFPSEYAGVRARFNETTRGQRRIERISRGVNINVWYFWVYIHKSVYAGGHIYERKLTRYKYGYSFMELWMWFFYSSVNLLLK